MDRDSRNILLILLSATVFKVLFAAPLYLVDDEAYYWVWSRHLSWSYFDHPPLIAVLIRLSTLLFGSSPAGIRALCALASGVAIWLGLDLTYRIYRDKKVLWNATWLYLLTLPFFGAGVLATPDTPLLLFLAIGLWSFYRAAYEVEKGYWWVSGLAFGLALLSKYTAILWLGGVFLLLLVDPRLRRHLHRSVPWLAGLTALLLFTPVIYWNVTHDWASFRFQLGHGWGATHSRSYLGDFFAGQAGLLTPVVFILLLILWGDRLARWRTLILRERFLLFTSLLPFLFFLFSAVRSRPEANWPAPAYFTGLILVAHWHAAAAGWRRWIKGLNLGLLTVVLVVVLVQLQVKLLPLAGKSDPTNRFYGWPEALDQVECLWHEYPAALPVGNKYQVQGQLAYRFGTVATPALNIGERPNHFDYFDHSLLAGRDLLIVSQERQPCPEKFAADFKTVEHLTTITGRRDGQPVLKLQVYRGMGYSGGD